MKLALAAGALRGSARGTVDLEHHAADLDVTATAPAMTPRPDLSWQSVALDAKIDGPFVRPAVSGTLDVDALKAAGASVAQITAKVQGSSGGCGCRQRLPESASRAHGPDLLAAAPVEVAADVRLDQPDRPIRFSLAHPLITAEGEAAHCRRTAR